MTLTNAGNIHSQGGTLVACKHIHQELTKTFSQSEWFDISDGSSNCNAGAITFWHIHTLWSAYTQSISIPMQEEITQGHKRTRRDWLANRCSPLWQPLTQPNIILEELTEIHPRNVPQIQAAGKLQGLKCAADTGCERRTGEKRSWSLTLWRPHSEKAAQRDGQSKQTQAEWKTGKVTSSSGSCETFHCLVRTNRISASTFSVSYIQPLKKRTLPWVTLWHVALRSE